MTPIASPKTLAQAAKHLLGDPILKPIVRQAGLPNITPHTNYYQELVDSIISQQLSVKAARTIERRFCELFGSSDFPPASQILARNPEEFRAAGLSGAKSRYVHDLAAHVESGKIRFSDFTKLTNSEITAELTAVKGLGEWSAHMFLIFCMGRLDILPVGDLGIKNGIKKLYGLEALPGPEQMREISKENSWHPYESVAAWYVWYSLDNVPKE